MQTIRELRRRADVAEGRFSAYLLEVDGAGRHGHGSLVPSLPVELARRLGIDAWCGRLERDRFGLVTWADNQVQAAAIDALADAATSSLAAEGWRIAERWQYPLEPARVQTCDPAEDPHAPGAAGGTAFVRAGLPSYFEGGIEEWFALPTPLAKRLMDVTGSLLGLLLLAPLMLFAGALVKATSPGPILYRQWRTGRGGKPFLMLKFRSMIDGADDLQGALQHLNEQDGPAFKIRRDPRVTWWGRVLRATCVDELPQLWNVLRGDMSLVGPRPLPCSESAACHTWQRRRLAVLPGVTGLWQMSGGHGMAFDDWMRLDVSYVDRRSLAQDLWIIVATIPLMFPWRRAMTACRDVAARVRAGEFRGTVGGALVLFDQAVVSGASLCATVLVGRRGGPDQLGVYAIGFTVLVLVAAMHDAFISSSFTVLGNGRRSAGRRQLAAAAALLHVTSCALFAGLALLVGGVVRGAELEPVWSELPWILAATGIGTLTRDFCRRFSLARLQPARAVALDVVAACVHLVGIAWLARVGRLSAASALLTLGGSGMLASAGWCVANWRQFAWRTPRLAHDVRACLQFGAWIFGARLVAAVHSYLLHWWLALSLGADAVGVYAACTSIAMLANPLLIGSSGQIGPLAAVAFARRRKEGLLKVVRSAAALLGAVMTIYWVVIAAGGDWFLQTLYGNQYRQYGAVVAVLGLDMVLSAMSMCAYHGLVTLGRSDVVFRMNLLSLAVTIVAAFPLMESWGLLGAAWALVLGSLPGATMRVVAFRRLIGRS